MNGVGAKNLQECLLIQIKNIHPEKELEKEIVIELEKKKKSKEKFSLWTLTSLTVGILTAIISFYTSTSLASWVI